MRGARVVTLVAAAVAGCTPVAAAPRGTVPVVATTPVVGDIVRQVGGGRVHVTTLVAPSVDPHEYSPSPQAAVAVARARLVVSVGAGFDGWLAPLVREAGGHARTVDASRDVRVVGGDPHVFGDPANGARMAATIAAALAMADPRHAAAYRRRAHAYEAALRRLRRRLRAQVATLPPARRVLVTDHDAFGYYARAVGLRVVGTVIPGVATAAEPSAGDAAGLVRTLRRDHVPAIFAEATVDAALSRQIADEAGAHVETDLYGDGPAASGPAATYMGMLRWNTDHIVAALR
jgi:zinc/manganese transport system substrate-binding protein